MITTNDHRKVYAGNGVTTVFAGPMAYSSDVISVEFVDASGVSTPQLSGWTLSDVGGASTTVTFGTAPIAGITLIITRTVPYVQQADLANLGPFMPKTIEQALDLTVQQTQQLADASGRAVTLPQSFVGIFDPTLPTPVPSYGIKFSAAANALEAYPLDSVDAAALRSDLASSTIGSGGSLVTYMSSLTGATARSVSAKLGDCVSICDFGASLAGTAANNRLSIQRAIDAGAGNSWTVIVPPGDWQVDLPPNMRMNTTLLLMGNIHNISNTGTPDDCAISMGSYTMQAAASLTMFTCYDAGPVQEGSNSVTLDAANSAAGIAAMPVGTLIYMKSKTYFVSSSNNVPTYAGLAMVTANDGVSVITFSPPIDETVANLSISPANNAAIPVDTNSGGLYAAFRCAIIGNGGLISDNYYPIARGGRLECTIDVGLLAGHGGHYGNLICHSFQRARNIRARFKIQDVAFCSNNSLFECVSASCDQSVAGTGGMLLCGNENSRKLSFVYGYVSAPSYTGSSCVLFGTGAKNCSLSVNYLYAPLATASLVGMTNSAQTVSGDQIQHPTTDNSVRFGVVVSGAASRYVRMTNDGGMCARNSILSGRFTGAVTTEAMLLEGVDLNIGQHVRCENGALNITANTIGLTCVGAYFSGDVKWTGSTLASVNVIALCSQSAAALRASYVRGGDAVVNSTTANNVVATSTCAASSIAVGDKIRFRVSGTITGTSGTKTVQVRALTAAGASPATMAAWVSAASDVGDFALDGSFTVTANTSYAGAAFGSKAGAQATVARLSRSGLNLAVNGHRMSLEAWVANAADAITIDAFEMWISRPTGSTV